MSGSGMSRSGACCSATGRAGHRDGRRADARRRRSHDGGKDGRRRCAGEGGQAATGRRCGSRIRELLIRRGWKTMPTATGADGRRRIPSWGKKKKNGYVCCCFDSIYDLGLGVEGDAAPRSRSMLPGAAQRRRRVEDRIELTL